MFTIPLGCRSPLSWIWSLLWPRRVVGLKLNGKEERATLKSPVSARSSRRCLAKDLQAAAVHPLLVPSALHTSRTHRASSVRLENTRDRDLSKTDCRREQTILLDRSSRGIRENLIGDVLIYVIASLKKCWLTFEFEGEGSNRRSAFLP